MDASAGTGALDMPGATSGEVHNQNQWGNPLPGQTSVEMHGRRKKERSGLEGTGAVAGDGVEDKAREQGLDLEGRAAEMKGRKGASGSEEGGLRWPGAEERLPVSAEEVAAERE